MKTIYLSGKIAGLDFEEVCKNFFKAHDEILLKDLYPAETISVINPTTITRNRNFTWADYIIRDLLYLSKCDAIYMLSNWQDSKGARVEHEFAKGLGIEILYQDENTREI